LRRPLAVQKGDREKKRKKRGDRHPFRKRITVRESWRTLNNGIIEGRGGGKTKVIEFPQSKHYGKTLLLASEELETKGALLAIVKKKGGYDKKWAIVGNPPLCLIRPHILVLTEVKLRRKASPNADG